MALKIPLIFHISLIFLITLVKQSQQAALPCYEIGGNCTDDQNRSALCEPIYNILEEDNKLTDINTINFVNLLEPNTVLEIFPTPFFSGIKYLKLEFGQNICLPNLKNFNLKPYSLKAYQKDCSYFFSECEFKGKVNKMCSANSIDVPYIPGSLLVPSNRAVAIWTGKGDFKIFEESIACINWKTIGLKNENSSQYINKFEIINKNKCTFLYSLPQLNGDIAAVCDNEDQDYFVIFGVHTNFKSLGVPNGYMVEILSQKVKKSQGDGENKQRSQTRKMQSQQKLSKIYFDLNDIDRLLDLQHESEPDKIISVQLQKSPFCVEVFDTCNFTGESFVVCGGFKFLGYNKINKVKNIRIIERQEEIQEKHIFFIYEDVKFRNLYFFGKQIQCITDDVSIQSILVVPEEINIHPPGLEDLKEIFSLKINGKEVEIDEIEDDGENLNLKVKKGKLKDDLKFVNFENYNKIQKLKKLKKQNEKQDKNNTNNTNSTQSQNKNANSSNDNKQTVGDTQDDKDSRTVVVNKISTNQSDSSVKEQQPSQNEWDSYQEEEPKKKKKNKDKEEDKKQSEDQTNNQNNSNETTSKNESNSEENTKKGGFSLSNINNVFENKQLLQTEDQLSIKQSKNYNYLSKNAQRQYSQLTASLSDDLMEDVNNKMINKEFGRQIQFKNGNRNQRRSTIKI